VRDPPERVAAILETVRGVADEVVVAVDAEGPGAESPVLEAIADRLYRVQFEYPFEQYLAWLHSLCGGDWIFRIDGDEVPSAALAASLPSLIADPSVLQYRLPRRWLFRDPHHWLADEPWQPDYQIRIVRNDPATLRFRGTSHSSAEPMLPARYLAEPIYHLVLLVVTREDREQRVRRYDSLPGAPVSLDNASFYLPELREDLSLGVTPMDDKALVERVFDERARSVAGRSRVVPVEVPLSDVFRLSPGRELDARAYEVEITCLQDQLRFVAERAREVPVRLQNHGSGWFPWGDWCPQVRASYHWLTAKGDPVVPDGHRTLLTSDLAPNDEAIVPLLVVPPPEAGRYILEIDLVHEGIKWFGCATRVPATVERE
jgi:hypothetical protein